jgi:hypothetical protein
MKKHLLRISIAVAGITGMIAQPTLTQAFAYTPGHITSGYGVDSVGVLPGNSGANQTWNFTGIQVGSFTSNTVLNPASTPYFSDFPTATAAFSMGNGKYQYYKVNSTSTQLLGQKDANQAQVYQNTQTVINYPFTYNTNNTDVMLCNYSAGLMVYRTGSSSTTGDAYGTLQLPSSTFNNVLRVHYVYEYKDSMDFGGVSQVTYFKVNEYHWFNSTDVDPLFSILYVSTGVPGNMTDIKLVSVSSSAVGIETPQNSLQFGLFPNPASTEANLQFDSKSESQVKYEIFNLAGQKVKQGDFGSLSAGNKTEKLNVADLSSGIYFLTLDIGGVLSKQKLIIE